MTSRMTWPDLCRSERYKGLWVAIDNCRYDASTRQRVIDTVRPAFEPFVRGTEVRFTSACWMIVDSRQPRSS